MRDVKTIWLRGLGTGLVLAGATTAAIMLAGDRERDQPWAAVNAICHVVDGDAVTQPDGWEPRHSLLGMFINGTAMTVWGILYEGGLAVTGIRSNPLTGALAAATAYVIDYHVVPKKFTPGIEKKLSQRSVLAVYLALGTAFALSGRWNKKPSS